jgi:hypothetical protein
MAEIAEAHPRNFSCPIVEGVKAERYEVDAPAKEASGLPNDSSLDLDDRAAFMIEVSKLEPCNPSRYCPAWKAIEQARTKEGQPIMSLNQFMNRMDQQIKSWDSKGKIATHVTMNNGRFHVADKDEAEFLRWYAQTVSEHKRVWFVEQLTPIFRYFVDLDFAQLVGIPERAMQATAKLVQRVLLRFYPSLQSNEIVKVSTESGSVKMKNDEVLRAIVCTTNYKFINAKDGKPEMVKTGVHILWPNVYLTRDDALDIRESIVVELEKEFGKRLHPLNSWQDVVDSSVYGSGNFGTKGSGLRMVGSRKTDTCNVCKGRKKIKDEGDRKCPTCDGNGRLDTGRPYFPLCVLNSFGERDRLAEELYRTNIHALVLHTKVRTLFESRPSFPEFMVPDRVARQLGTTGTKRGRNSQALKDSIAGIVKPVDASLKKSTACDLNNSTLEWDLISNFVRASMQMKYKDVMVSKITTNAKKSQYIVHVSGDGCRYCHNIKREHTSNRIYFVIDVTGIAQRCHDGATEATPEMLYGLCKNYVGIFDRMPRDLVAQLFPSGAAAKNLPAAAPENSEEDENDDEDVFDTGMRRINKDRKMAKLYKIGDALSQEIFKMNWSDTLRTSNGEHVIARQRLMVRSSKRAAIAAGDTRYMSEQYALNPAALGTRGNVAMLELGFEDLLTDTKVQDDTCPDARKHITPLAKLTHQLFKELEYGVELAASLPLSSFPVADDMGGFDGLLSRKVMKMSMRPSEMKKNTSIRDVDI